jgi:hypothetical protein
VDTYRSALSDLGNVGLGLGCFSGCGSLLGGSGLGCSLGSGLLGCSSLLSRGLLCSGLVDISMRVLGYTITLTHGLLGLGGSGLWCGLGGSLGLGLLGLCLLGGRRRAGLALCNLHGSRGTCCQSESRRTNGGIVSRSMDEDMLTLGTLENTSLATLGKSTVELGGESGIGHAGEVVVGLDVFLEGLTAVKETSKQMTRRERIAVRLTCFLHAP